jgi:hypothetical protein
VVGDLETVRLLIEDRILILEEEREYRVLCASKASGI